MKYYVNIIICVLRSASVTVIVYINDINDECPSFTSNSYMGQVTLEDRFVLEYDTVDRLVLTAKDIDTVSREVL